MGFYISLLGTLNSELSVRMPETTSSHEGGGSCRCVGVVPTGVSGVVPTGVWGWFLQVCGGGSYRSGGVVPGGGSGSWNPQEPEPPP